MSARVAYHRYSYSGQYNYHIEKYTPARICAGERIIADENYLPRSDDQFLIEHAGRMLELLIAIEEGAVSKTLDDRLRKEIKNLIKKAALAGIDIIAMSEQS